MKQVYEDNIMKCEKYRDLLSWYLDKEIQSEEIRDHLSVCKKCSKELEMLKEMLAHVRMLPQIKPPDQTCLQVVNKVKAMSLPGEVIYRHQEQEGGRKKIWIVKRTEASFAVRKLGINYKFESRVFKGLNGTIRKFIKLSFS